MTEDPGNILAFDQTWQRTIEQDHRSIKDILERLEATADPCRLLLLLDELRDSLVEHFEREEAPDGMHEIVASMAPNTVASLQNVLGEHREHRELLDRLDLLRQKARDCLEGPVAAVRSAAAELSESLRAHEARESRLFTDAIFTDLGRSS